MKKKCDRELPQDDVLSEDRGDRARKRLENILSSVLILKNSSFPMNRKCELIFVFRVKSMGLFAEEFAVGWVVDHYSEGEIDSGYISIPTDNLMAGDGTKEWLGENVFPQLPAPTISEADILEFKPNCIFDFSTLNEYYPYALRSQFWEVWLKWLDEGASAWVDRGLPVEINFLNLCIRDNVVRPNFTDTPHYVSDLITLLFLTGKEPGLVYERLKENETPVHHPTKEARMIARLIRQCFEELL